MSSVDTSSTGPSRIKRAISTWEHSRPPRIDEIEREDKVLIFYCKHCPKYHCKSTTTARNHLQSKHNILIEESQRITTLRDQNIRSNGLSLVQKFNDTLVRLIIQHDLPFRAVEWPALQTLLSLNYPQVEKRAISSHSTVSKRIDKLWLSTQDLVRKRIQSALSKIHFAADIWTSPNRILFLGICIHFVDRDTQQHMKALLGLRPILTHRGDEQAAEILSLFEDFGVIPKLGYFIGDNHPSNDVLCRALSSAIESKVPWDAAQHRLRCNGHILNLAVQAFLFEKATEIDEIEADLEGSRQAQWRQKGSLGKLHNIAVHIRGSPARNSEFKVLAGRGLPLDNETRWNSWFLMLQVALEISTAIDTYSKNWLKDLQDDYLLLDDWKALKDISGFLKPFYRATLETQGATIDRVLWTMDILVKHYEKSLKSFSALGSPLQDNIYRSWLVFDKYYAKTEAVPAYATALVLHPSRRLNYIKKNWKKEWQKPALEGIQRLWNTYRDDGILDLSLLEIQQQPDDEDLDEFDKIAMDHDMVNPQAGDEYNIYTREKPISIEGSALNWWLANERRKAWPKLSRLAIDILSIPAMSDEPERVFSGARRTISWDRMQMGAENIEKTQCLKSWMALKLDLKEVDDVDEVEEADEAEEGDDM
jgi:hypothetical protein